MATDFIASKIGLASKEKQKDDVIFKWTLTRERWRIRTGKSA
jgi:hypothetical protein